MELFHPGRLLLEDRPELRPLRHKRSAAAYRGNVVQRAGFLEVSGPVRQDDVREAESLAEVKGAVLRQPAIDHSQAVPARVEGPCPDHGRVGFAVRVAVGEEVTLDGRLEFAGQVEQGAQEQAAQRIAGGRRQMRRAVALGQIEIDGLSLVQPIALGRNQGGDPPGGVDREIFGRQLFAPDGVDLAHFMVDSDLGHHHLDHERPGEFASIDDVRAHCPSPVRVAAETRNPDVSASRVPAPVVGGVVRPAARRKRDATWISLAIPRDMVAESVRSATELAIEACRSPSLIGTAGAGTVPGSRQHPECSRRHDASMTLAPADSTSGSAERRPGDPFASAICLGGDWRTVADGLVSQLAGAEGRLGILYTAESFAPASRRNRPRSCASAPVCRTGSRRPDTA